MIGVRYQLKGWCELVPYSDDELRNMMSRNRQPTPFVPERQPDGGSGEEFPARRIGEDTRFPNGPVSPPAVPSPPVPPPQGGPR